MPTAYIFIGQSGCGKGTQATLLKQTILATNPKATIFTVETGDKFRSFVHEDTFTAQKTKAVIDEGVLPPAFLGVHMWSHTLMYEYEGQGHIVVDGTPRNILEVPLFLGAVEWYGWKAHVIYIAVGDEWAYEKTVGRGRPDDKEAHDVWGRIKWFHESVQPAIDMLKDSLLIEFHMIHGEQTVEQVHADICHTLGL